MKLKVWRTFGLATCLIAATSSFHHAQPVHAASRVAYWCSLTTVDRVAYYSDAFFGDADNNSRIGYGNAFGHYLGAHYDLNGGNPGCTRATNEDSLGSARSDRDAAEAQAKRRDYKIVETTWTY